MRVKFSFNEGARRVLRRELGYTSGEIRGIDADFGSENDAYAFIEALHPDFYVDMTTEPSGRSSGKYDKKVVVGIRDTRTYKLPSKLPKEIPSGLVVTSAEMEARREERLMREIDDKRDEEMHADNLFRSPDKYRDGMKPDSAMVKAYLRHVESGRDAGRMGDFTDLFRGEQIRNSLNRPNRGYRHPTVKIEFSRGAKKILRENGYRTNGMVICEDQIDNLGMAFGILIDERLGLIKMERPKNGKYSQKLTIGVMGVQ